MTDYLPIILDLLKLLLILSATASAMVLIVGLLHPLTFNVKLRASQFGQRAEIWASYLFGMLKIGVIATPNTQDVTLKILFYKKLLQRNQRPRPPGPQKNSPGDDQTHEVKPETPAEVKADIGPAGKSADTDKRETKATADTRPPGQQPLESANETQASDDKCSGPAPEITPPASPAAIEASSAATVKEPEVKAAPAETPLPGATPAGHEKAAEDALKQPTRPASDQISTPSDSDTHRPAPEQTPPIRIPSQAVPDEIDATPLKPLGEVASEQTREQTRSADQPEHESSAAEKPAGDDWRAKARRFRRDFGRRYRQVKSYIRLFMRKWQILSPVFWRFWARGKKGFSLSEPGLMVRYALHEPYITGMFHATMSMLAGAAGQFGINFVPVPVFSEPCFYARGRVTAIIRPWRFAAAMLGLLLERNLYRELWLAFKWYRANRQQQ